MTDSDGPVGVELDGLSRITENTAGIVDQAVQPSSLTKLRLQREQELMTTLADKCYKGNDYTYHQAATCQNFYTQNDFKLNLLGTFVRDHMTKHL